MPGDNKIFPLVDRRAPLLERIRGDEEGENVGEILAIVVGSSVKSDDEEELEAMRDSIRTTFTESLANNLGVSEEEIDEAFANDLVTSIINANESDVLTADAMEKLGIKDVDDDAEDGEDNGKPDLF